MNPSIIRVLLHIGAVLKTIRDVEQGIAHVVSGHADVQDLKTVLADLAELIDDGIITLPGLTSEQLKAIAAELRAGLGINIAGITPLNALPGSLAARIDAQAALSAQATPQVAAPAV
jgi:hypothetical protein